MLNGDVPRGAKIAFRLLKRSIVALLLIATVLPAVSSCDGGGGEPPAITSFYLSPIYEVIALGETVGLYWASSRATSARIKLVKVDNGHEALAEDVPTSTGSSVPYSLQTIWPQGEYDITLKVENEFGSDSRALRVMLVGPEGVWYKFRVNVLFGKTDSRSGFRDQQVSVSIGRSEEELYKILSVSKYVACRKMKWIHLQEWPPESVIGATLMQIRKLTSAEQFRNNEERVFPWDNVTGSYYCTCDWSPYQYFTTDQVSFELWFLLFAKN